MKKKITIEIEPDMTAQQVAEEIISKIKQEYSVDMHFEENMKEIIGNSKEIEMIRSNMRTARCFELTAMIGEAISKDDYNKIDECHKELVELTEKIKESQENLN